MKIIKNIAIGLCACGLFAATSCNDMLDIKPSGQFTSDQITDESIEGLMASAYAGLESHFFGNNESFCAPITNWVFDVRSDDAYKGGGGVSMEANIHQLEISNLTSDNATNYNKWRNNYSGIEDFQAVLDQATKYLAAAKEAGKLGAGINTGRAFGWSMYNGMYSFLGVGGAEIGITYCDGTFTVKDGVAGEHYKLYAKTMADWYKEGYIRSDIMSVDTSTLTTPKNGEITDTTYVFSCDPYLTEADQEAAIADAGMDMTYLPIEENAYLILGGDTSYAIPYCADEPERAMMVLNAIYSQPDLYNTLIYGIEGEDYTKNADGTITTSYAGASPTADDSYGIQRWIIGSCKNALINNGTDPNYYADLEALEATAQVNPFLNFTFDRTNVEGICASLLNVYYEYGPQLDNGVAGDNWEELYNNYMAARKDAGIEELVTEFQNQLNAYIEANNITSW